MLKFWTFISLLVKEYVIYVEIYKYVLYVCL